MSGALHSSRFWQVLPQHSLLVIIKHNQQSRLSSLLPAQLSPASCWCRAMGVAIRRYLVEERDPSPPPSSVCQRKVFFWKRKEWGELHREGNDMDTEEGDTQWVTAPETGAGQRNRWS